MQQAPCGDQGLICIIFQHGKYCIYAYRHKTAPRLRAIPAGPEPVCLPLLSAHISGLERVTGVEPALSDWKSDALPLDHTRRKKVDNSTKLFLIKYSYICCLLWYSVSINHFALTTKEETESMYEKVSKKIKTCVELFVILGIILTIGLTVLSILSQSYYGFDSEMSGFIFKCLVICVIFCFGFWLSGLLIYGFAQLIEDTHANRDLLERISGNVINISQKKYQGTNPLYQSKAPLCQNNTPIESKPDPDNSDTSSVHSSAPKRNRRPYHQDCQD